jgi:hypothetical protein
MQVAPQWIKNEAQIRADGTGVPMHVLVINGTFGVHSDRFLSERGISRDEIRFTANPR